MMTQKSPNLEVVSDIGSGTGVPPEFRPNERRRLPRLNLAHEQFRDQRINKIFPVVDLSLEGMALRILEREDLKHFPVAADVPGLLNLRGEKYPVRARVRHIGADMVGLEFEVLDASAKEALSRFLDPEKLGHELKPIPGPELSTIWYRGPSGTNLLFWRHPDGQYYRVALFVLGSCIQWDEQDGLSTGRFAHADEVGEVRGIFRYETMLLQNDENPDPGKIAVALKLLQSSALPPDLKKWCSRHFKIEKHKGIAQQ